MSLAAAAAAAVATDAAAFDLRLPAAGPHGVPAQEATLGSLGPLAHEPVGPSALWSGWHVDPLVVAGLAVLAVAYRQGLASRRRPARQVWAFVGALVVLAVALASPLDGVAAALFSGHMVQHLLLIVVAAPLLVAGRAGRVVTLALPRRARHRLRRTLARRPLRQVGDILWHPLVVWGLGTVVLWVWHLPSPYEAALRHDALHGVEHLTLLATALLGWAVVLGRGRHTAAVPVAVLLLFGTALQGAALGAVLVFARTPLYPIHEATAPLWDLTPLEDQQLAGGLMWVPPGLVYLAVTGALVVRWFNRLDEPKRPTTPTTEAAAGTEPRAPDSGVRNGLRTAVSNAGVGGTSGGAP